MTGTVVPSEPGLSCDSSSDGAGVTTMRITGDIDMLGSPELTRRSQAVVDSSERHLIMDFERVAFVDVFGLNTLLAVHRGAASAGCGVVLRGTSPRFRRLLSLSGTEREFVLTDA